MKINKKFGVVNSDGSITYAPIPLPIDGNTWTNNTEIHEECGYYPVQKTEQPIKEEFYYTPYWVVENEKCVQKWEEHKALETLETETTE